MTPAAPTGQRIPSANVFLATAGKSNLAATFAPAFAPAKWHGLALMLLHTSQATATRFALDAFGKILLPFFGLYETKQATAGALSALPTPENGTKRNSAAIARMKFNPPQKMQTAEQIMKSYYNRENFPELVAHSTGWNIYAKTKPDTYGHIQCAALPTTRDRWPHSYGTIEHVARMITQGYLRPVIGNLHFAKS